MTAEDETRGDRGRMDSNCVETRMHGVPRASAGVPELSARFRSLRSRNQVHQAVVKISSPSGQDGRLNITGGVPRRRLATKSRCSHNDFDLYPEGRAFQTDSVHCQYSFEVMYPPGNLCHHPASSSQENPAQLIHQPTI